MEEEQLGVRTGRKQSKDGRMKGASVQRATERTNEEEKTKIIPRGKTTALLFGFV